MARWPDDQMAGWPDGDEDTRPPGATVVATPTGNAARTRTVTAWLLAATRRPCTTEPRAKYKPAEVGAARAHLGARVLPRRSIRKSMQRKTFWDPFITRQCSPGVATAVASDLQVTVVSH